MSPAAELCRPRWVYRILVGTDPRLMALSKIICLWRYKSFDVWLLVFLTCLFITYTTKNQYWCPLPIVHTKIERICKKYQFQEEGNCTNNSRNCFDFKNTSIEDNPVVLKHIIDQMTLNTN